MPIPYPTPESGNSVPDRPDYQQGAAAQFDNSQSEHAKKRQKRNKPTLSCEECVGRKTKVGDIIHISCDPSYIASKSGGVSLVHWTGWGLSESIVAASVSFNFFKRASYMRTVLCSRFIDW